MIHPNIALIGAGHMGSCLIQGLLKNGYPATAIWACDHQQMHLDELAKKFDIHITIEGQEAVSHADVVIFAVRPQQMMDAVKNLQSAILQKNPLMLSVVTGIHTTTICEWLGKHLPVVRAMPNTPALVGSGATGLYANGQVSDEQRALAESILRAVGLTLWVDHESKIDVVTALSGSGPAYLFYMMEAMAESAENLGLEKQTARLLTIQTVLGAARLALEDNTELSLLRAQVTAKGGTTERAMMALTEGNFKALMDKAIRAAHTRAQELAELFK